jgi:hypothetical protein
VISVGRRVAFPSLLDEPRPLRIGLAQRLLTQNETLAVGKFPLVQEPAFPAVGLTVKPQLAVDLPAVFSQGPQVFTGRRFALRLHRRVKLEPVLVGRAADRSAGG